MALEFLDKIPNELWIVISGISGGALTLLVTYIQNRAEKGRLEIQLLHDKDVRREEREMSMRREIYYDAIEYLAVSINFLSTFSDADLKSQGISSPDMSSKFQRIQLIAGKEVLDSFNECSNLMAQSFVSLLPLKMEVQKLETDKGLSTQLYDMASEQQRNITRKMEELNKEKIHDNYIWTPLKESAEQYSNDIQKHISEGLDISEKIYKKKMVIVKKSIEWLKPITAVAGTVLVAMRKELDDSMDEETLLFLEKKIIESSEKSAQLMEKLLRDMEAAIEVLS